MESEQPKSKKTKSNSKEYHIKGFKLKKLIRKLQTMNNKQPFLCLPKSIIQAKNWQAGDLILIEMDDVGNIVLKRKE